MLEGQKKEKYGFCGFLSSLCVAVHADLGTKTASELLGDSKKTIQNILISPLASTLGMSLVLSLFIKLYCLSTIENYANIKYISSEFYIGIHFFLFFGK